MKKRLISIFLTFAMVLSIGAPVTVQVPLISLTNQAEAHFGSDHKLAIGDVLEMLKGLARIHPNAAISTSGVHNLKYDVNCDGFVRIDDVLEVLKVLAKILPALPSCKGTANCPGGKPTDDPTVEPPENCDNGHDLSGAPATCTTPQICARADCTVQVAAILGHIPNMDMNCTTCSRAGCSVVLQKSCTEANPCSAHPVIGPCATNGHTSGPASTCTAAQICTVCFAVLASELGHVANITVNCTTCARTGCSDVLQKSCVDASPCPAHSAIGACAAGHDNSGAPATCTTPQICARADCNVQVATPLGHSADLVNNCNNCVRTGCGFNGLNRSCSSANACSEHGEAPNPCATGHDTSGPGATCIAPQFCARANCNFVVTPALGHSANMTANCNSCLRTGCSAVLQRSCSSANPCVAHATPTCLHPTRNPANCTQCSVAGCGVVGLNQTCTPANPCGAHTIGNDCANGHDTTGAGATCLTAQVCARATCSFEITPALGHSPNMTTDCRQCTRANCQAVLQQSCTEANRCTAHQVPVCTHPTRNPANCTQCSVAGCGVVGLTPNCTPANPCGAHTIGNDCANGHDTTGAGATCLTAQVCARATCSFEITPALGHSPNMTTDCRQCTRANCQAVLQESCTEANRCAAHGVQVCTHVNRDWATNCSRCVGCGLTGLSIQCSSPNFCPEHVPPPCTHPTRNPQDCSQCATGTCTVTGLAPNCVAPNLCGPCTPPCPHQPRQENDCTNCAVAGCGVQGLPRHCLDTARCPAHPPPCTHPTRNPLNCTECAVAGCATGLPRHCLDSNRCPIHPAGQLEGFVIFNMHTHPELTALEVVGGGASTNAEIARLPFVRRNSGSTDRAITVNMTAPRTITTTNRGGSLQSVQFRLNDINIRANHTYNFAIAGSIGTAAHATATAVLRNGGASGDTAIGTSPIGAGGAFSITMSRTAAQVTADLAQGEHAVYSLGNTSGLTPGNPNIIVNTMSVIETCPPACTTCVVRTITLNAGGGTGVPATLLTNQYTGRLETLPEPTRSGFKFMGWFTAATGGDSVDISRIYTANTTIFARWMSLADKVIPADLTAAVVVAGMGVGWNLGNTLDSRRHDRFNESSTSGFWAGDFESASATPNVSTLEQLWNVPVTTATLITGVKNAGFDTIRIPVTWHKATDPANNWTIRADWMARVKQLVDFAYNIDMYVIINTHHDEYILPLRQNSCPSSSSNGRPVTVGGTRRYGNRATAETVLPRLWTQICATFNNEYGYKLIFEGINEPRDPRDMNNWTATDDRPEVADRGHGAYLLNSVNRLNQIFVNTVRASSGNNANRILMTPTYAANADSRALNGYRVPTDSSAHRITVSATNVGNNNNGAVIALNNNSVVAGTGDTSNNVSSRKIALSIHRYEPHTFTLGSSTAVWTEAGIRSALQTPRTRATALGIPVVLGEWGVTNNDQIPAAVREAGRAHYANCYVRVATEFGMRTILWDNGNAATRVGEESHGHLNRANGTPHFPAIVTAIRQGRLGQRSCTCTAGNCRNLPAHS